jgi:hypothetical protein
MDTDDVNDLIILVTVDEYAATQYSVDGLDMFLRQNGRRKPRSTSDTPVTPIGFRLLPSL